jgi:hypothetical protein
MMREKSYVKARIKKLRRMLDGYVDHDLNILQKLLVLVDLAFSIVIYGVGITDYFQYQFYKRRHLDRKDFIVHRKRMWLVKTFNDKTDRLIFDNKDRFNSVFNNYLHRRWLNPNECSFEEFKKFAEVVGKMMVKPIQGSHGIGIRIEDPESCNDLRALFSALKAEKCIIEELIDQHEELAEFNPGSVNTLRVVSILGADGKARLMTANLRVGHGDKYADNFHHEGIAALIDLDSGVVVTTGIDKNFRRYIIHPLTGKQIIGFKVPYWDRVKDIVGQAACVIPTVRYVGWDIAIGKKGEVLLVEGNAAADPDVSQMPDQIGKWPHFKRVIEDYRLIRQN